MLFNFFYERHSTTLPVCKFLRHIFIFLPTTPSVIRISTPRIVVCFAQSITTFTACYRVFFFGPSNFTTYYRVVVPHYGLSRGVFCPLSPRAIAWFCTVHFFASRAFAPLSDSDIFASTWPILVILGSKCPPNHELDPSHGCPTHPPLFPYIPTH